MSQDLCVVVCDICPGTVLSKQRLLGQRGLIVRPCVADAGDDGKSDGLLDGCGADAAIGVGAIDDAHRGCTVDLERLQDVQAALCTDQGGSCPVLTSRRSSA